MNQYYASVQGGPRASHAEIEEDNRNIGWTWEPVGPGCGLVGVDDDTARAIDAALETDGSYSMPGMGTCADLWIEAP